MLLEDGVELVAHARTVRARHQPLRAVQGGTALASLHVLQLALCWHLDIACRARRERNVMHAAQLVFDLPLRQVHLRAGAQLLVQFIGRDRAGAVAIENIE